MPMYIWGGSEIVALRTCL